MATASRPHKVSTSRKTTTPRTATTAQPTSVSAWKAPQPPLELPSGNYMSVRKSSFQVFIKAGIIPNSLMSTVQQSLSKGQAPEMSGFDTDPEKITEMVSMVDSVLVFVSIDPKVYKTPKLVKDSESEEMVEEEERDPNKLYVDDVDEEDKMYIFQYVTGGVKDLEQFRKNLTESLAAISAREGVES